MDLTKFNEISKRMMKKYLKDVESITRWVCKDKVFKDEDGNDHTIPGGVITTVKLKSGYIGKHIDNDSGNIELSIIRAYVNAGRRLKDSQAHTTIKHPLKTIGIFG